nr:hypothetical protein [Mycobacterium avium]
MTDDPIEPTDGAPKSEGVEPDSTAVSRRRALGGAVLAGLSGAAIGAVGGGFAGHAVAAGQRGDDHDTVDLRRSYPFYGQPHQGGIDTPPQRYAMFMVVLTFLEGCSGPSALGFELPRDVGYGFHVVAVLDGRRRLAARRPATTRPLIERCDWIAV